ncbi:MAG TPA: chorismate-binding protein [Cytophagaceae bacterium]
MFNSKVNKDQEDIVLHNFLLLGLNHKLPFAIWSLPQSTDFTALLSEQGASLQKLTIETSAPGFVVAPFRNNDNSYYICPDYFYSTQSGILQGSQAQFNSSDFLEASEKTYELPYLPGQTETADEANYLQIVALAKEKIQQGNIKKVVLARKEIVNTGLLDLFELIKNIRAEYPSAFISLVFIPEFGLWIGATPELLLEVSKDKTFKTVALAGTQKNNPLGDISNVAWTQKEIEEQALVNRYIINCFKHLRLREYEDEGPRTVKAGNLLHLRTDFSVDMVKLNTPTLGSDMLTLLHPTSAVGGSPKEEALVFIDAYEGIDRQLFSGYIGPVNINGSTNLFVNLRCANLYKNKAVLFAGAGITQDSDPAKELLETSLKMSTIGKYLINDP